MNGARIFNSIDRGVDTATRVIEVALAVAFVFAVATNFVNVVGRYLFGFTFLGADELQIYIMIWMAFLGAAIVTRREQHLRMDVIVRSLPVAWQRLIDALCSLVLLVIAAFIAWQSFLYAARIFALGQVSDMARIPMWIPHGAVVLGFLLVALMTAYAIAKRQARVESAGPPRGEDAPP